MFRLIKTALIQTHGQPLRSIIQGMLDKALALHKTGHLNEAKRIYHLILEIDPAHADALHLLGMSEYQAGCHVSAIALIGQAIAIDEKQPAYHTNLGTIFHAQGRLEEAAACYQRALDLQPNLASAHYNLGNVFHAQEKLDEAAACYRRALAADSTLAEAYYNLGNVLQTQSKLDEAIACYEQALAIDPGKFEALHNLGNALQSQDKFEQAKTKHAQTLALKPDYAKAHFSLGGVYHLLGDFDDAIACYRTALDLDPHFAEARFGQSLTQLLRGDFSAGWGNYESRWQTNEHTPAMRAYAQQLWSGETLASGKLLIWGEQGIGDEIMFAGLLPEVVASGNRCILDCDPRLKPLFLRSFPHIEVISSRAPTSRTSGRRANDSGASDPANNPELEIAAHLPCGRLPKLFRKTTADFACRKSPYLLADPVERAHFRARYSDGRWLVGLAWYTNNRKTGRIRSIDLKKLSPLFSLPDIRWISLQYGEHDRLESQVDAAGAPLVVDRSVDQFDNIDRFAAQIAALDLVVTIDNSTAHLAGALGVPTWVLLPFVPDWRWLLQREGSLWYSSLRLFRQPSRGDWESVIQGVQSCLYEGVSN